MTTQQLLAERREACRNLTAKSAAERRAARAAVAACDFQLARIAPADQPAARFHRVQGPIVRPWDRC